MNHLYIGLDNSQPNVVRVVCLTLKGALWSNGSWWRKVNHLNRWVAFWRTGLYMGEPTEVACTALAHDPFDILAWVRSQGIPVTHYHKNELPGLITAWEAVLGPPPTYRRAYALALRAAYKHEAPKVVEELWHEMGRLSCRLTDVQRAFNRLLELVPCSFPCPF
jgi:hypothetical protein